MADPTETDPDEYVVVFENDRRVSHGAQSRDVTLRAGEVRWLDAQTHAGENIGSTPSHALFIELRGELAASAPLDPS